RSSSRASSRLRAVERKVELHALSSARLRRSGTAAFAALPPGALGGQMPAYAGNGEPAVGDRTLDRGAHRVVSVPLEQRIEFLDVTGSELAVAMRNLRQHSERMAPEIEHLLPLLVELCSLAMHRGDLRGSMLLERRGRLVLRASAVERLVPASDDAESIL